MCGKILFTFFQVLLNAKKPPLGMDVLWLLQQTLQVKVFFYSASIV